MSQTHRITVAKGDGIGPEIMDATLKVLEAAQAPLTYDYITIGKAVYESGYTAGITPEDWETLRRNKVFLKAPITTPQGSGYKSLNVTIRKSLGLYSNVRACQSFAPMVRTKHPKMDVVVVRENEEDLYAGIEHRQTTDVFQCLKLVSIPGTRKIIRYAFEYAKAYGRKKVTCMVKDNIMKVTDGLYSRLFNEIKQDYPDIESELRIIDIGAALLADRPEDFDVIVTLNLYGDIISDIAAQISGSVGLGGSANIGREHAMFEAVHGSAPDIAGQNAGNPSGLMMAAVQMLLHLGAHEAAQKIHNAWLRTLEDGLHTGDLYQEGQSQSKVGTREFAEAVIERLGQEPARFKPVKYAEGDKRNIEIPEYERPAAEKLLVGSDLFVDDPTISADDLGAKLQALAGPEFKLKMITNRGVKVFPDGLPETFCTDHWRCRFVHAENTKDVTQMKPVEKGALLKLMQRMHEGGVDVVKTENLYYFDGQLGFSLGQGE
jgi:isocitrate dehydrogenase